MKTLSCFLSVFLFLFTFAKASAPLPYLGISYPQKQSVPDPMAITDPLVACVWISQLPVESGLGIESSKDIPVGLYQTGHHLYYRNLVIVQFRTIIKSKRGGYIGGPWHKYVIFNPTGSIPPFAEVKFSGDAVVLIGCWPHK